MSLLHQIFPNRQTRRETRSCTPPALPRYSRRIICDSIFSHSASLISAVVYASELDEVLMNTFHFEHNAKFVWQTTQFSILFFFSNRDSASGGAIVLYRGFDNDDVYLIRGTVASRAMPQRSSRAR